ncbi:LOW QUALITY PROTEIN: uncharacterized PE-PGRS family protein PE_PGRS54-like [Ruditapes philippinarum]|uniref:LOW QUALITY PROTEIN: uncharacterized PE-PGRS family protein PE_PGRS54-like n=1 Tax=Ruditapes philippinarum TaxID=129788 RepID=UPI00295B68D4|nr:LOW QUALITY PROTEIN: uncharacterized PE-PGRS family protein PE_PGRS54-like [Ruditapes philippinarum]
MARSRQSWITKCVNIIFVVTLIQIIHISGIYSQKIDSQTGPLILNVKEPPDILDNANLQNTIQNVNNRNTRPQNVPVNQRPMKFLCNRQIPVLMARRNVPAQTTRSPFTVTAVPEVTETNKVLHVKVESQDGQTFRGFMMQVLSAEPGADDTILGEFISTPNVNLQTCYSNNDTATSADGSKLTSTYVMWKAPNSLKDGSVIVRATLVQDYKTYWIDVKSDTISFEDMNTSKENNTVNNGKDTDSIDLDKSIAETFEGFDGPFESADEVLLHQGIRKVDKLDGKSGNVPETDDQPGVIISPPKFDEAPTAPLPPPRYVYRTMNQFAPNFEPPTTSEFVGQLLGNMLTGGNRQPAGGGGGGGLGSMMNMMGMASKMLGGGNGGGGGGLMSSLGTMSKLSGMLGGGSGGGGGGLGGLGALSSMLGGGGGSPIGGMLGGGTRGGNANAPPPVPPPTNRGGGGIGGKLSSLLGFGNKNTASNVAPMPVGGPVNPNSNREPSLADLLGVDPSIGMGNTPTVIPAEANPIAGVSAAKAGGGILSKIGGFAPVLAMAPIAFSMFGKKKKPTTTNAVWSRTTRVSSEGLEDNSGCQVAVQDNLECPQDKEVNSECHHKDKEGNLECHGQQGQFGGAPGQFGRPPQGLGFGPTQPPAWPPTTAPAASNSKDIQQIIQLLEAQRLQIEALKAQVGGASITSQMGGFGNIPLSFGQKTSAQLLGLSGQNGLSSGLGGIGSTLSTFEPVGPPKVEQKPQSSSNNDLLLQQLLQQNQMLMQQNQQFQTNMLNAAQGQGQFGATSGNTFNRVNRSNGQIPMNNGINPADRFGQNAGQNNFLQSQNNGLQNTGLTNGLLPGSASNGFLNSGQAGQGNAGIGAANNAFNSMPNQGANSLNSGMGGGQGPQRPQTGGSSTFGQFGGSNQGASGGSVPAGMSNNANGNAMANPADSGSGGSLTSMFGGGGGGGGGGLGSLMGNMLGGGGGGGGGGGNPLASLMGGGGGGGGPDIGSLMGSMLGGGNGGGGGGMDMSKLLGNVDMNAMQGMLNGEQGQDLMKSVTGMLSGPGGGDLMKAMEGMMSGNGNPADIMGLMGKMDMNELQGMAKQAEGLMASSGIDPAQILGMMG